MSTIYDIANEFIRLTDCSVFITGKAGSGKTTLLRKIQDNTPKQIAVVAPTGVAAINAGGVTIHSFFQLPLSPFIPTPEGCRNLIAKQRINDRRRKVLRNLELLVIDEISMVRADIIDAIDTILRHYRSRRDEPFGGVQVIYIGDLYQLSPVCVDDEWSILREYYPTPYFFSSLAVQQNPPFYIELDKIFRQSNLQFINLLNQVRNNSLSQEDFDLLDKRYHPGFKPKTEDGYITLTTHNASADAINNREIELIDAPTYTFKAVVDGEFPEKSYPAEQVLQLKLGAKVMFIANDSVRPQRYYNGKLGIVSNLTDREIWVTCDGEREPIHVDLNTWDNCVYEMNRTTNTIEEKQLGSFIQYPLRLAWAITIHKSQGLTFDKVVIDAAAAFAAGQVYVALSRCRSLDGIVLTSRISANSLFVNQNIVSYCNSRLSTEELEQHLDIFKSRYSLHLTEQFFNLEELMSLVFDFNNYLTPLLPDFNKETEAFATSLKEKTNELYKVARNFIRQLNSFTPGMDDALIAKRIKAASGYYTEKLGKIKELIESARIATESKTEADDFADRIKLIHETVSALIFYIKGIADDFSVTNCFAVRRNFRPTALKFRIRNSDIHAVVDELQHPELFKRLVEWRDNFAMAYNMEPKDILSAKVMKELSQKMPLKVSQLSLIKGFTAKKRTLFGKECLRVIAEYCSGIYLFEDEKESGKDTKNVDTEQLTESNSSSEKKETGTETAQKEDYNEEKPEKIKVVKKKTKKEKPEKVPTLDITLGLVREGKTVEEIAAERNLVASTIYGHIIKLLLRGDEIDIIRYTGQENFDVVSEILAQNPEITNTEIYEHFEEKISFEVIRMVRTALKPRE